MINSRMDKIIHKLYLMKEVFLIYFQLLISKFIFYLIKDNSKKGKKIVVGFRDIYYNGNPRAVYEYMRKFPEKYECFWLTKNRESYLNVKKNGGIVYYIDSLKGISLFLRTDIWVISHRSLREIPSLPHHNYKVLQLWHGIGYKKYKNRNPSYYNIYDVWCTSSEWVKNRHINLWNAPEKLFQITGYARIDRLVNYVNNDKITREDICDDIGIFNNNKNILYAPTWTTRFWPWDDQVERFESFCKFCKRNNLNLIVKLHPYSKIKKRLITKIIRANQNVIFIDMKNEPDTEKILYITDILITDISSIATDFLYLKRPIIYINIKKGYIDQIKGDSILSDDIKPGEKVSDENEFYSKLKICLEKNRYYEKQKSMLLQLQGNVDGKASARVAKVIDNLMSK